MLNPDSAAYARENGAVVLLNESFDTCYARIQGDTNRPIVQRSTKEELHQLFDQLRQNLAHSGFAAAHEAAKKNRHMQPHFVWFCSSMRSSMSQIMDSICLSV